MGTNFYLLKKLNQEEKQQVINELNNDNYDKIIELLPKQIHIGKRSGGWKFLWDAHYFKYFKPNKDSLFDWLKSGQIIDEYGEEFSFEQFINDEIANFLHKGYDIQSYYENNPEECMSPYSYSIIKNFQRRTNCDMNINQYGEFYIDDLRFTVSEDFG